MSCEESTGPTWNDLIATIGSVSVAWSFLEGEMRAKMQKSGLREKISKGSIITHWRAFVGHLAASSDHRLTAELLDPVEQLAVSRNLLVHGIQSVSLDPYGDDGAVVICTGPDGTMHKLTIENIHTLLREIDKVRMSIQGWCVERI